MSIAFSVLGLLSGPSSTAAGGFRASKAGAGSGLQGPNGSDQAWPYGSNRFFDTISGAIEDIGPLTLTGSYPFLGIPGGAGFGPSLSLTARPDGSADLYIGAGVIIGTSARASAPGFGATVLGGSTGERLLGLGIRAAGAIGIFNPLGLPIGIRGSAFRGQGGDNASAGLGLVGGVSGSLTYGRYVSVAEPYEGPCQ